MTTLYISPHLDDVALSCAGGLLARRARGERVVVCSLFTRTRNRTTMHRRAAEEAAAWFRTGVEGLDLGYDDAPDREGIPATFTALMLGTPPDPSLVRDVRGAIAAQVRRVRPDEVWLPLAIGGHVDHRAVFDARAGAAAVPTVFYADRPYAFVRAFVALRHAELTGTRAVRYSAATIARQVAAGACAAFVDAAEHEAVMGELAARLARPRMPTGLALHRQTPRFSAASLAAAAALIGCYGSQTRALFGRRDPSAIWRRLARIRGGWCERAYTIT